MLRSSLRRTLRSAATSRAAEHALERPAGIGLHRQALRFGGPRNRIHVAAAVAGNAAADITREIFGCEFERRERCFLPDVLGENLIDADAHANVFGFRRLCQGASQPTGRTHGVIGRVLSTGAREIADQGHLVAERFQWFEDRPDFQTPIGCFRCPVVHDAAVGQIHRAETQRRLARGLRQGRHRRGHRFQEREGDGGAHSTQKCSARQRLFSDDHFRNLLSICLFSKASPYRARVRSAHLGAHLERNAFA